MRAQYELDELTLNAFVDGQLDADMERMVLNAMDNDTQIREQVHALRRAKDWMRAGFADAQPRERKLPTSGGCGRRMVTGIAASFMLVAVGIGGGLIGYKMSISNPQGIALQEDPDRVLLHLDESEPEKFAALLDYTEQLLSQNDSDDVQVEVIANAGGIDLMRAGVSPLEHRVRRLSVQYDNLHFIACANAIRNLRKASEDAMLISNVHAGKTAVDHIVDRLRSGWTYRKVNDLPGI